MFKVKTTHVQGYLSTSVKTVVPIRFHRLGINFRGIATIPYKQYLIIIIISVL